MRALNNTIDVTFSYISQGAGHYSIYADVSYPLGKKLFYTLTNDTEWVDNYNDKKSEGSSYDELQQMYHDKFMYLFVDDIIMWMYGNEFGKPFNSGKE